jgi:hypothetical protein
MTFKLALPRGIVRFDTFHDLIKLRARNFPDLDHE